MNTQIIRQGSFEALYGMPMFVNWLITDMCNYRCSYCFGQKPIDKTKLVSLDKLKIAVDNIMSLNRPIYDFVFSGGEPTIHPNLIDLIHYIDKNAKSRLNKITIITNGSRTGNFYDKLAEIAQHINLNLVISIHTDHVDINHIYDLIKLLANDIYIGFNLMFHPNKFEFVKEIYSELMALRKEFPFSMNIKTLREPPDFSQPDSRYTDELFAWQYAARDEYIELINDSKIKSGYKMNQQFHLFRDIYENHELKQIYDGDRDKQFNTGLCNFNGMYCIAGVNMIRINPNGIAKGVICPSKVFTYNIYDECQYNNLDFMHIVHCHEKSCGCVANDYLPKFLFKKEAIAFLELAKNKQRDLCSIQIKTDYINKQETLVYIDNNLNRNNIFWNRMSPFYKLFTHLDTTCILEYGCGNVFNIEYYADAADNVFYLGTEQENINSCKQKYQYATFGCKVKYFKVNNCKFADIRDKSITSLFTYETLIHYNLEPIIKVVKEANRVLIDGGYALFHHSNSSDYPGAYFRNKPHARNFMSCNLFAQICIESGFDIVEQIVIPWGRGDNKYNCIDALSLVVKKV